MPNVLSIRGTSRAGGLLVLASTNLEQLRILCSRDEMITPLQCPSEKDLICVLPNRASSELDAGSESICSSHRIWLKALCATLCANVLLVCHRSLAISVCQHSLSPIDRVFRRSPSAALLVDIFMR